MEEKINSFLNDFELNEPVFKASIFEVEKQLELKFPKDYFDFMLESNGGEGSIGQSYLILWKIEDLIELNEAYGVEEFAPGLLIIGSDGGDTAYCIDTRSPDSFVQVPFIGMDLNEVQKCGNSFVDFIKVLFKG